MWVRLVGLLFLSLCGVPASANDPNPASIHSERGAWPLHRQWTVAESQHFARWIEHIYDVKTCGTIEQRMGKLERVLTDPEINLLLDAEFVGDPCNPQLDLPTIRGMHQVLDCAKLTVALSTYYAYRRGLPWMISHVRACDGGDLRTAESTIPQGSTSSFEYPDDRNFFLEAVTAVCTGNFRVDPDDPRAERSDTVPVAIDREHLLPGCLFYLDGHVLILAKIDKYGEPHFLDATTASSRDIYTYNGFNAVTGLMPKPAGDGARNYAGCYRGFRVYRYPLAETDSGGEVLRVRRRTDQEMLDFGYSTEQYDRLRELMNQSRILEAGIALDSFHDFIRLRVRSADRITFARDIEAFRQQMLDLLERREQRVQDAWHDVRERGPIPFPEARSTQNVFTPDGRWGAACSAIVDMECRAKYLEFLDGIDSAIPWFDRTPDYLDLDGLNPYAIWSHADLAVALMRAKQRIFSETVFRYKNSTGQEIQLSLADVEKRLFDLSFDPNHPPELRWGAQPGSPEAQTAPEMETPLPSGKTVPMTEAYRREAYYRSLLHRETDESYLTNIATEGFPIQEKFDDRLARKWLGKPSPPLVPHTRHQTWLQRLGLQLPR